LILFEIFGGSIADRLSELDFKLHVFGGALLPNLESINIEITKVINQCILMNR